MHFYRFKFDGKEHYEDWSSIIERYGDEGLKALLDAQGITEYTKELPPKEWLQTQRDSYKKKLDALQAVVSRYDEAILLKVIEETNKIWHEKSEV